MLDVPDEQAVLRLQRDRPRPVVGGRQRRRTGTDPGTSCSTRTRRPRPTATTPQRGQPINAHGVEAVTVSRVGPRSTASTWTPSRPSRTSQRGQGSVVGALAHPVALDNVEVLDREAAGATDHRGPRPHHRSTRLTGEPPPPPDVRRAAKAATATILRKLIAVPARIATSARRLRLHLPAGWPWANAWTELFFHACGPPTTAGT